MSRTYRRKGINNPNPGWVADYHWHSDGYDWRSKCWKSTREHTIWRRRVDEKAAISHLVKDAEFDYYDREKVYRGYIWMFD